LHGKAYHYFGSLYQFARPPTTYATRTPALMLSYSVFCPHILSEDFV